MTTSIKYTGIEPTINLHTNNESSADAAEQATDKVVGTLPPASISI